MASKGIRDRVAIVGMGCTKFGEHWDKGTEDLLVDAAYQAYESAGVGPDDVDAYWLGTMGSGISGLTLSEPLKIQYKPVTRVENMCATGSEALRQACYAVANDKGDIAPFLLKKDAEAHAAKINGKVVDFADALKSVMNGG